MMRSLRTDRGIALVVASLVLVMLMAFAALAVDMGGLYNARRQDQSAADMGALAAAQELPFPSAVAALAIEYAEVTLGVPVGSLDFDSCTDDPGALAVVVADNNCVSLSSAGNRVRVRLPDQVYETYFARLVGLDEFTHSAFAEAEVRGAGFGNIMPFGVPSLGTGGGYICPATPPSGLATEPCSGPDSGNFGYLNLAFYQVPECQVGGGANRFPQNLAMGVDHDLARYDGNLRDEFVLCESGIVVAPPNLMHTETGNVANRVAEGMISGPGNPAQTFPDGEYGRLTRASELLFAGQGATVAFGPRAVDDNPLWDFIPATLTDVPHACRRDVFVDPADGTLRTDLSGLDPNFDDPDDAAEFLGLVQSSLAGATDAEIMIALLDRCFTHYKGDEWGANYGITPGEPRRCGPDGCDGAVFSVNSSTADTPDLWDIQYTPRFGYVPEFFPVGEALGCDPTGVAEQCVIQRFRAVFIQQLCVGPPGSCTAHDPGFGVGRPTAPGSIAGVTAWAFPDGMLPGGLAEADAPTAVGVNRFVFLVR
jgi:hypothetical protein